MGGYPGACTNNGLTAEGYIDGCTTDMQGVKWWAVIGAVFVHGNARFIFHQPIFAGHLEAGDIQGPGKRFEWSNDRQESANRVTFSIIRDSHTKQTRIKRAWIRCTCPSHGECKRAPEAPTQPGKES